MNVIIIIFHTVQDTFSVYCVPGSTPVPHNPMNVMVMVMVKLILNATSPYPSPLDNDNDNVNDNGNDNVNDNVNVTDIDNNNVNDNGDYQLGLRKVNFQYSLILC